MSVVSFNFRKARVGNCSRDCNGRRHFRPRNVRRRRSTVRKNRPRRARNRGLNARESNTQLARVTSVESRRLIIRRPLMDSQQATRGRNDQGRRGKYNKRRKRRGANRARYRQRRSSKRMGMFRNTGVRNGQRATNEDLIGGLGVKKATGGGTYEGEGFSSCLWLLRSYWAVRLSGGRRGAGLSFVYSNIRPNKLYAKGRLPAFRPRPKRSTEATYNKDGGRSITTSTQQRSLNTTKKGASKQRQPHRKFSKEERSQPRKRLPSSMSHNTLLRTTTAKFILPICQDNIQGRKQRTLPYTGRTFALQVFCM